MNNRQTISTLLGVAFVLSHVLAVSAAWGQCEVTKLVASDGSANDHFGWSVAIDGEFAVVGADDIDDAGGGSGAAYIFRRDLGGAGNWGQVTKLTASDAAAGDNFGTSVAISGDTVIIGARRDDAPDVNSGSAYIFYRNQGGPDNWAEVVKLTAADAASNDWFGTSVSIDGDTAIVGAFANEISSAYIFQRDEGGPDNWGQIVQLAGQPGASFGQSVSIDADTAIVGASNDSSAGFTAGAAYIFHRSKNGNWQMAKQLIASDAFRGDAFGLNVSIDGDHAIVGAYHNNSPLTNAGAAYVFRRNQGGPDNWGEVVRLTASDATPGDEFGYSVSISSTVALIGARADDDAGTLSGSAYVFRFDGSNWIEEAKIIASDAAEGDEFGWHLAVDGNAAIVGAYLDDDLGIRSGSAYIFLPDNTQDCNCNGVPDGTDIGLGTSQDCNGNSVPDECDLAEGASLDCNMNGLPDECDITSGISLDINGNGVPDECDCLADINGSGAVNVHDLVRLLLCFGSPAAPECQSEDVNFDGTVNVLDLIELLLVFGTPCL